MKNEMLWTANPEYYTYIKDFFGEKHKKIVLISTT